VNTGARIYNLFPLLFGPVRRWAEQLPRIGAMGFDWVYLNPFHAPGAAGHLYAARDHERLHPLFRGGDLRPDDQIIRDFVREANANGLRVMMDLVVTQLARDAVLVARHPDWFVHDAPARRDAAEADEADASAEPEDIARFDYGAAAARRGQAAYWADYIYRHIDLGIEGFRCARACRVPAELWHALIDTARSFAPASLFVADTAGAGLPEIEALRPAGFDYVLSAAKWWDFRSDWLLAQQEQLRRVAATISFPESHETPRLAAELGPMDAGQLQAHARLRYLFAATFSAGVSMPAGYEYGFTRPLDSARTRPEAWEQPRYDLSGFIAAVNGLKAALPVLAEEGPQRRITAPRAPVIGLLRQSEDRAACALTLINADARVPHSVEPGALLAATGTHHGGLRDVTPERRPAELVPGTPLALAPLEARLFVAERLPTGPRESLPITEAESESRLRALAEQRLAIEAVEPEIDGGRHPVKRCVGDLLEVSADIFGDGHEQIAAVVKHREAGETVWRETPMTHLGDDRWSARLPLTRCTRLTYTVEAWRDLFGTWRADLLKKRDAGQDVAAELYEGRDLLAQALDGAAGDVRQVLESLAQRLDVAEGFAQKAAELLLSGEVTRLMARFGPRGNPTVYRQLEAVVDRTAARFSAWYEMFPRSMRTATAPSTTRSHGWSMSATSASTWSVSRRSTRSAAPGASAATARRRQDRTIQATPTRSAPRRAAIPRCIPGSARWTISAACWMRRAGRVWRLRSISPASAHPTIPGSASIRTGSSGGPTAASSPPRTRRAATTTSSTSGSTARRCPRPGTPCAMPCCSGQSRACACSASTGPRPGPSRSGNG
jgi:starch synthase (maltosyl-transferring)